MLATSSICCTLCKVHLRVGGMLKMSAAATTRGQAAPAVQLGAMARPSPPYNTPSHPGESWPPLVHWNNVYAPAAAHGCPHWNFAGSKAASKFRNSCPAGTEE